MDFVTIGFDPDEDQWILLDQEDDLESQTFLEVFNSAAERSGLQWEHLDKVQEYMFRITPEGLRFLGTQARWGEFVPATQDQLVLRRPA